MKKRAIFLDRDGVINTKADEHDYVKNWQEFRFIDGSIDALRNLKELGFLLILVTNQRGIARKLMTERDLKTIHQKMQVILENNQAALDDIFFCPHDENECKCRKPQPGLILSAVKKYDIELSRSYLIDDSDRNLQAGKLIGCKTILIRKSQDKLSPDLVAKDLLGAARLIRNDLLSSGRN